MSFTMQEYCEKNGIAISLADPQATRIVAAHLKKLGYVKVKRQGRAVYMKEGETPDYSELKAKLEVIEDSQP